MNRIGNPLQIDDIRTGSLSFEMFHQEISEKHYLFPIVLPKLFFSYLFCNCEDLDAIRELRYANRSFVAGFMSYEDEDGMFEVSDMLRMSGFDTVACDWLKLWNKFYMFEENVLNALKVDGNGMNDVSAMLIPRTLHKVFNKKNCDLYPYALFDSAIMNREIIIRKKVLRDLVVNLDRDDSMFNVLHYLSLYMGS